MAERRILIVEDEFMSRQLLVGIAAVYGKVDVAVNGEEAIMAFKLSYETGSPYDLVFLDIMLPLKDGQTVLRELRSFEEAKGIPASGGTKVVMTTALTDSKNVMTAFRSQCEAYIDKPYSRQKIEAELAKLGILPN